MVTERREYPRIDSHNLVYLVIKQDDEVIQQGMGRTLNISQSGIRLETSFVITQGHTIWMTIGFMEDTVDIQGELVYYLSEGENYGYGMRFLDINTHAWDVLNVYIRNFNREEQKSLTDPKE